MRILELENRCTGTYRGSNPTLSVLYGSTWFSYKDFLGASVGVVHLIVHVGSTRLPLRPWEDAAILPHSIAAFASAFTTAVMVPLCPRTCGASKASSLTIVVT